MSPASVILGIVFFPVVAAWSWIRRPADERACAAARRRGVREDLRRVGDQLVTEAGPIDWAEVAEARWYDVAFGHLFAQDEYAILLDLRMRDGRRQAYWASGLLREGDAWPGLPVREGERVSSQALYWFLFGAFGAIPLFVLALVYG